MVETQIIPLFPLGIVALPGVPTPLHIFEERYKEMIGRCLEENLEFGIVWFNGEQMRSAGTSVRIEEVIKRFEDGRLDILTRGYRRFQVVEVIEKRAYLEGQVLYFEDDPDPLAEELARLTEKGAAVYQELVGLLSADSAINGIDLADPVRLSFFIAGFEGFGPTEKQAFLEMTSTRVRLQKGIAALETVVERLRLTREVERIVGGNGHPTEDLRQKLGRFNSTAQS
jgi:Lon protease-like protein